MRGGQIDRGHGRIGAHTHVAVAFPSADADARERCRALDRTHSAACDGDGSISIRRKIPRRLLSRFRTPGRRHDDVARRGRVGIAVSGAIGCAARLPPEPPTSRRRSSRSSSFGSTGGSARRRRSAPRCRLALAPVRRLRAAGLQSAGAEAGAEFLSAEAGLGVAFVKKIRRTRCCTSTAR